MANHCLDRGYECIIYDPEGNAGNIIIPFCIHVVQWNSDNRDRSGEGAISQLSRFLLYLSGYLHIRVHVKICSLRNFPINRVPLYFVEVTHVLYRVDGNQLQSKHNFSFYFIY